MLGNDSTSWQVHGRWLTQKWRRVITTFRASHTVNMMARWVPLTIGIPTLISNLVLLAYFVAHARRDGCGAPPFDLNGMITYAYSFFSLNLLVSLYEFVLQPWRRVYVAVGVFLNLSLVLLMGYHYAHLAPLDVDTLLLNAGNGLGDGVADVIVDALGTNTLIVAGSLLVVLTVAQWRLQIFGRSAPSGPRFRRAIFAAVTWAAIVLGSFDTREPITYLARTCYERIAQSSKHSVVPEGYPYATVSPVRAPRTEPLPPVILLMMESFNARYVTAHTEQGVPIMPVFQSLIPRGVYWEWFYGNSIQTSKGHAATLLSVLPSTLGKILVNYRANCFQSIASVLKQQGYGTLFFQAYANVGYEHGNEFYRRNGFDRVMSAAETHGEAKPGEAWGWGFRDDVFYQELFRTLDTLEQQDPARPRFVVAAPVANHTPFDRVPQELRYMYPEPQNRREHYSNSIHLSDAALSVFFDELGKRPALKDALVIITGDHSFPTGEHGFTTNVASFYEEFFRTPLLMIWPGHLEPKRISDVPHSQIDIAPTLIDLLGFSEVKHHFLGQSLFHPTNAEPTFLVQPYSGRYLGVVDAPYKYVLHERSGQEYLFNLVADPDEQHNLAMDPTFTPQLEHLRPLVERIYVNEELLITDRVWGCQK